ncbi:unnamed protein product [Sphagnum balticum]
MIYAMMLFANSILIYSQTQATQMTVLKAKTVAIQHQASDLDLKMIEAARKNLPKTVDELLKSGAEINAQDAEGWTALMEAADRGFIDLLDHLIAQGADLNIRSKQGKTALIYAARCGFSDCATALIKAGADLDIQDLKGRNALIYASRNENPIKRPFYLAIVQALISGKAQLNLTNHHQQSALMYAVWHDDHTIAQTLKAAGADKTIADATGKTPDVMLKERYERSRKNLQLQSGFIEGNYYTYHAIEQMKRRAISIEDVQWVLAFGKAYKDKDGSNCVKVAHPNKNIGVVYVTKNKQNTVITVISFINHDELEHWLEKEKEVDNLAWLEEHIDVNAAHTMSYATREPDNKSAHARDDEREIDADYDEELEEIQKFRLGDHIDSFGKWI